MRRIFLILVLFLRLAHPCASAAQALFPHDLPDTAATDGAAHIYRFCDSSSPFTDFAHVHSSSITAAPLTVTGTATYSQTGYDSTTPATNCSAQFSKQVYAAASTSTPGNYEWNVPWTAEIVLSTNALGTPTGNTYYPLMYKGTYPYTMTDWQCIGQACNGWNIALWYSTYTSLWTVFFMESGQGQNGTYGIRVQTSTTSTQIVPGSKVLIHVVNPGDGVPTHIQIWINGIQQSVVGFSGNGGSGLGIYGGFGGVYSATVTNGGTGYLSGGSGTFTAPLVGTGCNGSVTAQGFLNSLLWSDSALHSLR